VETVTRGTNTEEPWPEQGPRRTGEPDGELESADTDAEQDRERLALRRRTANFTTMSEHGFAAERAGTRTINDQAGRQDLAILLATFPIAELQSALRERRLREDGEVEELAARLAAQPGIATRRQVDYMISLGSRSSNAILSVSDFMSVRSASDWITAVTAITR